MKNVKMLKCLIGLLMNATVTVEDMKSSVTIITMVLACGLRSDIGMTASEHKMRINILDAALLAAWLPKLLLARTPEVHQT